MDKFLEKLEQFKQKGNYAVTVFYGEGEGCDDSDNTPENRSVKIVATPVGYLGSVRVLIRCTVKDFLTMDLNKTPTRVSNPPGDEIDDDGFYYWGTDSALEGITPETVFKL